MSISRARTIAFDVLLRVAKQDAYADDVLRAGLDKTVKTEDAGLATELALGVLRWQKLLDFVIDRYLKKRANTADVEVRIALRLGMYQLLFLDRVPARAAVHESVELVKRARKRSAATLVNAILRKAAKEPFPGNERTRSLLQANNRVPVLSGYLLDPQRGDEAALSLQKSGSRIQPGRLLRDSWVLEGGNPGASEAVRLGWVAIQDEASQAVAHLVAPDPGNTILDLCAAPGGKTMLLARTAGARGHVIAADLHKNRVRAMQERFELAGIRNVETVVLDGAQPFPFERPFDHSFDRILVDVPCSGTGTLARHPEIRWKLRAEDLRDLHDRQASLLGNALPHLAPGGRLVYSTCSLEPEENEFVVREILGALGETFQIADPRSAIESFLQESVRTQSVVCSDGFFRTFPPEHGADGFFAAVIKRRSPKA